MKTIKNLNLSASKIEEKYICFFYERLINSAKNTVSGLLAVVNSNTGASTNMIEIYESDIFYHKKSEETNIPHLISIPSKYVDQCEFIE